MKELLIYSDMKEEGRLFGIKALIESFQEIGLERDTTLSQVMRKFSLTREQAETYVETYWKPNAPEQTDENTQSNDNRLDSTAKKGYTPKSNGS